MSDIDDFVSSFGPKSDEEKIEAFEISTLKLILGQMGMSAGGINSFQRDMGESFNMDWLNSSIIQNDFICATRCFKYNLDALLEGSLKHPIIKAYLEVYNQKKDEYPEGNIVMIFRAFDVGRLVVTNKAPTDRVHVVIPLSSFDWNIYITSFKNYIPVHIRADLGDLE
jgi:hypothetical protein